MLLKPASFSEVHFRRLSALIVPPASFKHVVGFSGTAMVVPQPVTDQEIQKWVFQHHGLRVENYWIAHCKELCGLTADAAQPRRDWQMCPPEVQPAIKQAFRHFGIFPPEP